MKCYVVTILFCVSYLCSFSQNKNYNINYKFSVTEVLKDIDYTEKYFLKYHPDPYKYISKDSLHEFICKLKLKIDSPLTEMQCRFYIRQIITKIGCGHSDAGGSKNYVKTVEKTGRLVLPLNTFIDDENKLYVFNNLTSDTTIKSGDEIIAFNKQSVPTVLKTIYSIYSSDGYNTTQKKDALKFDWFKYFYSFCYGFKPNYPITIKHKNGIVTSYTLTGIDNKKDTVYFAKRDTIVLIKKIKTCAYYLLDSNKTTAVIDINAFNGKHWRSFFKQTFKDIKQKKISNVVIDLRNNGGGQITKGLYFLSYLLPKAPIVSFDKRRVLEFMNPRLKSHWAIRLTQLLAFNVMPVLPKKWRLRRYFIALPQNKNGFKGNVFVLTNGKSFSMSCIAASYLKNKINAKTIGTETGGNLAGSNAIVSSKLVLPNSKIRLSVPLYHIYHHINVTNNGYGVMPNYHTSYSIDDVLKGKDKDIEKVKELLNIKQN